MVKALIVLFLLALAGCSGIPRQDDPSPCAVDPASYQCQIQRYHDVAG